MTTIEAIQKRHSVRRYTGQSVENAVLEALQAEVAACNVESGMNTRLVIDDPETLNGFLAKRMFPGAKNYIVLVGNESASLEEKAGYFGERIVLKAQQLRLNTCWAAMLSKKAYAAKLGKDESIAIIIPFGYGVTPGVSRKTKPMEALCKTDGDMPDWFRSGMEAAMLAPTARNQQKFLFTLQGGKVKAESTGGSLSKIDLGIVKYHFEIGAGAENFTWADT